MPLLCPRVCVLLLLPLTALSCTISTPPQNITREYTGIIHTQLQNVENDINSSLKNLTCDKIKFKLKQRCFPTYTSREIVLTLFNIACKMNTADHTITTIIQWSQLIESVVNSVDCPCTDTSKKKRENNEHKKLCRAKVFLSSLDECFQLLNTVVSLT